MIGNKLQKTWYSNEIFFCTCSGQRFFCIKTFSRLSFTDVSKCFHIARTIVKITFSLFAVCLNVRADGSGIPATFVYTFTYYYLLTWIESLCHRSQGLFGIYNSWFSCEIEKREWNKCASRSIQRSYHHRGEAGIRLKRNNIN